MAYAGPEVSTEKRLLATWVHEEAHCGPRQRCFPLGRPEKIAGGATVDDPGNSVGLYTSIAISADGSPVISYHDAEARALEVAKCANAACTATAALTTHPRVMSAHRAARGD